jgi:CIC family chloride channel protein
MTGEYRVMLPLMLASVAANVVYRTLIADSIFTLKFTREGRRLEFGRESAILKQYHVADIMDANPVTVPHDATFDHILKLFLAGDEEHYYVTDETGGLAGRITIHDVKDILHEESLGQILIAADLVEEAPAMVFRDDNLEDCLLSLGTEDTGDLPVLMSRAQPVLVGVVTRKAIFEVYNREVLHQEDMGIKLVHGEARMRDCVDLPEAYKVQVLVPPASWLGSSLLDLGLRPRYNISVLAVKHRRLLGGAQNELPDPKRPLEPGDRLIIVGQVDDLERLLEDTRLEGFGGPLSLS